MQNAEPIPKVPPAAAFLPEELARYSRHLLIPGFGAGGQEALRRSSVLVAGAGGLGSPVAMYLAAAGVGRLGIADPDVVDLSNLQRQILHSSADIGRPKTVSAKETIAGLNPHVQVETYGERLDSGNALRILSGYDLVVDGTDNFPTRYLLNDAAALLGKPCVYGSVFRFEGQVSVFDPARGGPCYRCLFPAPPPPGLVPSCAEGGVLGVLPGIVGSLQALATIGLVTSTGEPLIGRLLLFDGLAMTFRELTIKKDPSCPLCGERRTIHELIDYESFCGITSTERGAAAGGHAAPGDAAGVPATIEVEELKSRLDAGEVLTLLDVRETAERAICNLGGLLIPRGELAERLGELDPASEIIVYCRSGNRSGKAVEFLRTQGFPRARNLAGGVLAWSERIDPSMQRY